MFDDRRMHAVGHVDGWHVVASDRHTHAGGGNRHRRISLPLQFHSQQGIDFDFAQQAVLVLSAPRIGIDLRLQKLSDSVLSIADHFGRIAARRSDKFPANHQEPVFGPRCESLDQDARSLFDCGQIRRLDLLFVGQVHEDATPVIAICRLDDHGTCQFLRRLPSILGAFDFAAFRNRNARRPQQRLREILVLSDRLSDRTRVVRLGGPDPTLPNSLAQLHKTAGIQSPHRNVTEPRRFHNRHCARAETDAVCQLTQSLQMTVNVERQIEHSGHQQITGCIETRPPQSFLVVADGDFVQSLLSCLTRPTVTDRSSGESFQFQRCVLQNVGEIRSPAEPLEKPASFPDAAPMFDHRRQPRHQSVVKPRKRRRGRVLQRA